MRDMLPVAGIAQAPAVFAVNSSVPAKTVPEFIAHAKANPGRINMGSAGIGSTGHLAGELFKMMAGVDLVHVPYRGNAPALTDLIAGQIEVLFPSLGSSIEYVKAGKLRALAVTGATRSDALPDLPTVAETLPGYEAASFYGIGAPRNTPAEIVEVLNKAVNAGLADPQAEGPSHRPRKRAAAGTAGHVRQADRRRNRKMGQGDQVRRYQGRVTDRILSVGPRSVNSRGPRSAVGSRPETIDSVRLSTTASSRKQIIPAPLPSDDPGGVAYRNRKKRWKLGVEQRCIGSRTATLPALCRIASARTCPTPVSITMVVPFAAGGGRRRCRIVGGCLSRTLGGSSLSSEGVTGLVGTIGTTPNNRAQPRRLHRADGSDQDPCRLR